MTRTTRRITRRSRIPGRMIEKVGKWGCDGDFGDCTKLALEEAGIRCGADGGVMLSEYPRPAGTAERPLKERRENAGCIGCFAEGCLPRCWRW